MNKVDFLEYYRKPKITMDFRDDVFLKNDNIFVNESEVTLEQVGDFYCPWYYDCRTLDEMNEGIETILKKPQARAIKISDIGKIKMSSKTDKINRYKEKIKNKSKGSFNPFPVVTDKTYKKSLVLDGNHTLVALYSSWDMCTRIPVIEISGESIISILPEFCVIIKG